MADFRYGFFVRPDNKKIESNPEEKSGAGHISDPKSKPPHLDAGGRQRPTDLLSRTRYVKPNEKYTEEVHTKKYKPAKNSDEKCFRINKIDFNELLARAENEGRLPEHEMSSLRRKALGYLKPAANLNCSKNKACSASDHHKDRCTTTIDSEEAARRYRKFGAPVPVSSANVATIDCKEAARKYKGAAV